MLDILVYSQIDKQIKYGLLEVMNHLGVPFNEIDDLKTAESKNAVNHIIILSESSQVKYDELERLRRMLVQGFSIIVAGDQNDFIEKTVGCSYIGKSFSSPPTISGMLRCAHLQLPLFYSIPLYKNCEDAEILSNVIVRGGKEFDGIFLKDYGKGIIIVLAPQVFRSIAFLLSGSELSLSQEQAFKPRLSDKHGRIDIKECETKKRGFLQPPEVNGYEKLLFEVLLRIAKRKAIPLVHKWYYPANKKMALCLTHDVDHYNKGCISLGKTAVNNFKSLRVVNGTINGLLAVSEFLSWLSFKIGVFKNRVSLRIFPKLLRKVLLKYVSLWDIEDLLEIEKRFKAISSFYFLSNATYEDSDYSFHDPKIKEAMESLDELGCEVGLHGSYFSYNNGERILSEKSDLEKAFGKRIHGIRQHHLRFNVPETFRYQSCAGFLYDSTIGCNEEVGFLAGCCLPYRLFDLKKKELLPILEIPLIISDHTLFAQDKMFLSPEQAVEVSERLAEIVYEHNGVLTLLWHANFDGIEEERASRKEIYKKILQYCSKYNPWYTNGFNLAKWWSLREQVIFKEGEWDGSALKFYLISPQKCNDFSIKIYLPLKTSNCQIFVNESHLKKNIEIDGNFILFSLRLSEGKTEVRACISP